jgi:transposase-like protein
MLKLYKLVPINVAGALIAMTSGMQIPDCPHCGKVSRLAGSRISVIRYGCFYRSSDKKYIPRYKCQICNRHFSKATIDPCYCQKKRQFNFQVFGLLASGNTQRRSAILLGINRKTVARKLVFMGTQALAHLRRSNLAKSKAVCFEFDDLETFEHTKCKPLSVTLAVEYKSRRILGFSVSKMPAKGRIAIKAFKKYGPRQDERAEGRSILFSDLKDLVVENPIIKSDQNPHYPKSLREFFPQATHIAYKGRAPANMGQGELKSGIFDPIFSLNHTFAKMRADISRLIRETWSTTKRPDRLRLHIALMAVFHNDRLNN